MELKKYKRKREIPIGWKEIKLGDVFRTSSGATPLTTELSYYEGGNIPWINSGELASPYIYSTSNYITQKGFDNSSTEIYPKGTILVAMYGATAGKASMLKITACTNQAICAILPNDDYCPEFIKYNIDTLYEHLVGLSSGSARDNLSQAGLKELKLVLPKTKKEQENLIAALSLLDSKIELNKQINDNLEAMAKQLYDYWFVQFDFPNEEGKPYKSNGGAMVYNEKLKREIPQGWHCYELNKWLEIKSGFAFKSETYISKGKFKVVTIKNVQDHHLDTSSCDYVYEIPQGMKEWCSLSVNDRLISLTGNCGRLCIVTEKDLLLNQRVGLLACNNEYIDYAYLLLSSEEYQTLSNNLAKGAAQANLSPVDLCKNIAVLPKLDVLEKFNRQIKPIVASSIQNEIQIAELTKQRDELLPLLMNGQATVNYHLSDD